MKVGKKVNRIASFKVLGKYNLHFILVSSYKIDRWFAELKVPKRHCVMKLEEFKSFFPKVTSFFLYKKLFSDKAIIEIEDFREFLSSKIYYKHRTPTLELLDEFISFSSEVTNQFRRDIASLLHSVEELEKALTKSNFKVEINNGKEDSEG